MKRMIGMVFCAMILAATPLGHTHLFAQSVPAPSCAYCGARLPDGVHSSRCPYSTAGKSKSTAPDSGKSTSKPHHHAPGSKGAVKGALIEGIVGSVLASPSQSDEAAKQREAEIAAQKEAELLRAREEAANAEHDRMMQSYKQLDGSPAAGLKPLPDSGLNLKTLDGDTESLAAAARKGFDTPGDGGTPAPQRTAVGSATPFFGTGTPLNAGNDPNVVDLRGATAHIVDQEQLQLGKNRTEWTKKHKQLIKQRLKESNRWSKGIYASLKANAPPLPYKRFDELQPGDTLLIEGSRAITVPDQKLSGKEVTFTGPPVASHTVLYLKEINGKKLFLDNQPGEGPRIVPEDYIVDKYGSRGIEVAKLAQPLNRAEADRLYAAAREMRAKNLTKIESNKWFDTTTYGLWGKDNVVCSESDWALIRASGLDIPASDDWLKKIAGVHFSPQDFYDNEQYFLVSPLAMPKK